jgi:dipeptidyl aminopeptidase/acylaminoacyl peptidase
VVRGAEPGRVIRSQVVLEEHDVAAGGQFAVVVRRFVAGDRYRSHLWLVPLEPRGRPRQLTSGSVRDTGPRISADGRAVAFKRLPVEGRPRAGTPGRAGPARGGQVIVLPLRGSAPGTAWALRTPPRRAVAELAWSPDGRHLALAMEQDPPRFIVGPEPKGDDEPVARRIRRIDWRYDETGHVDRRTQLYVSEVRKGARPNRLTDADWDVSGIAWSPDGTRIAFAADPRADADLRPRRSIWAVPASAPGDGSTALPVEVLALPGDVHSPAWSPDGRWLAAIGIAEPDAHDEVSPTLVVGPSDGSRPAEPLTPDLDRPIGVWVDTDLHGWIAAQRSAPCWADERTIVAIVSDRGRAAPWRFEVDARTARASATPESLIDGDMAAHSLAVATRQARATGARSASATGPVVTVLACVGSGPLELVTVALDGGRGPDGGRRADRWVRVRTRAGGRWADRIAWPVMQSLMAPGPGGPIEVWIASPHDAPDGPMPAIVDIHGGPLGAWAPAPSIEVVLLCGRGYRVILPNIRGSATYGRDWIRPQLGDWGGVDADDVHAALDHAIAVGLADPARLGALGLSYGGFMVNWLIGTSARFGAAVSENGVTNQVSAWANSDTGVEYNRSSRLGAPLDRAGMERLWRQSPLSHVAAMRTPLLLLQAEADRRCPPADNEQLFTALRVLGRTVEYVLYPEESHVYQASGRPDRRIDRMTRMLDWFDRYLRA